MRCTSPISLCRVFVLALDVAQCLYGIISAVFYASGVARCCYV
jgi:hypothetical protein